MIDRFVKIHIQSKILNCIQHNLELYVEAKKKKKNLKSYIKCYLDILKYKNLKESYIEQSWVSDCLGLHD